jgi:hypothetical protein
MPDSTDTPVAPAPEPIPQPATAIPSSIDSEGTKTFSFPGTQEPAAKAADGMVSSYSEPVSGGFTPDTTWLTELLSDKENNGGYMPGQIDQSKNDENPQDYRDLAANMKALGALTGIQTDEIGQNYEQAKQQYVKAQNWDMPKTEGQFRTQLLNQAQTYQAQKEAIGNLSNQAILDTMDDASKGAATPILQRFQEWNTANASALNGMDDAQRLSIFQHNYVRTKSQFQGSNAALAKEMVDRLQNDGGSDILGRNAKVGEGMADIATGNFSKGLGNIGKGLGGGTGADPTAQDDIIDKLSKLSPKERKEVYGLAGRYSAAKGHPKMWMATSWAKRFSRAAEKTAFDVRAKLMQSYDEFIQHDTATKGINGEELTPVTQDQKDKAKANSDYYRIAAELSQAAKEEINPIDSGKGFAGGVNKVVGGLAEMIPMISMTMFQPEIAAGLLYASTAADQQADLLVKNENLSVADAAKIAEANAILPTIFNFAGIGIAGHAFPAVEKFLFKLSTNPSLTSWAANQGIHAASGSVMALAAGASQAFGEHLAAAYNKDVDAGEPLSKQIGQLVTELPANFASFLILGAAMSGHGRGDLKAQIDKAGNFQNLRMMGFSPEQATKISTSKDGDRLSILRDEADKRTAENILDGHVMAIQAKQNALDAVQDENTPKHNVTEDGTHIFSIPDGNGGQIEVARTQDPQKALQIGSDLWKLHDAQQIEDFNKTLDLMDKADEAQGITGTRRTDVKYQEVTMQDRHNAGMPIEKILASMRAAGIDEETPLSEVFINGLTTGDIKDGLYNDIITINNLSPRTAIHERLDASTKRAVGDGKIPLAQFEKWIRQTEVYTRTKYMDDTPNPTHQQIVEAVTAIGEDYIAGHANAMRGTASPLAGYFKSLVSYFKNCLVRAKVLRATFKEGKIERAFEDHLAESIGLPIEERLSPVETRAKAELMGEKAGTPEEIQKALEAKVAAIEAEAKSEEGAGEVTEKKKGKKPGTGFFGEDPVISYLMENPIRPKAEQLKRDRDAGIESGGEYDEVPKLPISHRQIFGGSQTPDQAHQALMDEGLMPQGSTTSDMWAYIENASKNSIIYNQQIKAQEAKGMAEKKDARRLEKLKKEDPKAYAKEMKAIQAKEKKAAERAAMIEKARRDAFDSTYSLENPPGEYPNTDVSFSLGLNSLHKLSEENLDFADRMGGLAVPSIAVAKQGHAVEGFGNIHLIGDRHLADPKENPVYDADAYSPRFPSPEYKKVKMKTAQKVVDLFKPFQDKFGGNYGNRVTDLVWDNAVNTPSPERAVNELKGNNAARAAFLTLVEGEHPEPVMEKAPQRFGGLVETKAFQDYLAKHPDHHFQNLEYDDAAGRKELGDAIEAANQEKHKDIDPEARKIMLEATRKWLIEEDGKSVFNTIALAKDLENAGKTQVDATKTGEELERMLKGKEAKFVKWIEDTIHPMFEAPRIRVGGKYVPYTIDNIAQAMKGAVVGQEKTMTYGAGNVRAETARKFSSIEEMKNAAETGLASEEEVNLLRSDVSNKLSDWRQGLMDNYKYSSQWDALDSSMKALADYIKKGGGEAGMRRALEKNDFSPSQELIKQGVEIAHAFRNIPVPYFESKPQRVVRLNEFHAAVIPDNASPRTREILEKNGIAVHEVPGDATMKDSSVAEALKRAGEDVTFSLEDRSRRDELQGERFDEFSGDPRKALDFLIKNKGGYVPGAIDIPGIGKVDLMWGQETGKGDSFGVSKILNRHSDVLNQIPDLGSFKIVKESEGSVLLKKGQTEALVKKDWFGEPRKWLATIFKQEKMVESAPGTIDTEAPGKPDRADDTLPAQDSKENDTPATEIIKMDNGETPNINFSISTRADRDRVNQEIERRIQANPDTRVKIYQRMQKALDKAGQSLDELKDALDRGDIDSNDLAKRQMEQSLVEINAVVSSLPPEIRSALTRNWRSMYDGKDGNVYTQYQSLGGDKARADFLIKTIGKAGELIDRKLSSEYLDRGYKLMDSAQPKNERGKGVQGKITPEGHQTLNKINDLWHMDPAQVADYIQDRQRKLLALDDNAGAKTGEEIENERDGLLHEIALAQTHGNFSPWTEDGTIKGMDSPEMDSAERYQALENLKELVRSGRAEWNALKDSKRAQWEAERKEIREKILGREGKATSPEITQANESQGGIINGAKAWFNTHLTHLQLLDKIVGAKIAEPWKRKIWDASNALHDLTHQLDVQAHGTLIRKIYGEDKKDTIYNRTRLRQDIAKLSETKATGAFALENQEFKLNKIARSAAEGYVENPGSWKGTDTELNYLARILQGLKEKPNSRIKFVEIYEPTEKGDRVELHLSEMEAIQRLLSWRQPDARIKMERNGMTQETADALEKFVNKTNAGTAFQDYLKGAYENYDKINAVYRRMFGVDMPRVKNYAPTDYDNGAKGNEDPVGMDKNGGGGGASMPNFAITRQNHGAKVKDSNAWITYQAHMDAVNYFLTHAELVRDMKAVFLDKEVLRAANAESKAARDQLTALVKSIANENMTQANLQGANHRFTRVASDVLANSALSFNAHVTLKHLIPSLASGMKMDPGMFLTSAVRVATMTAERPAFGKDGLFNSPEVKRFYEASHGWRDNDSVQAAREGGSKVKLALKAVGEFGHTWIPAFVRVSNSISSAIAYDGFYREAVKSGSSPENARNLASQKVDEVLHETSQPMFGIDRPIGDEGNPLMNTIARFAGPVRQRVGNIIHDTETLPGKVAAADGAGAKAGEVGKYFWRTAMGWVVPGLMEHAVTQLYYALLGTAQQKEDSDRASEYLASAISGPLYGVYWGGPLLAAGIKSMVTGDHTFFSSANPLADEVTSVIRSGKKVFKDGSEAKVADYLTLGKAGFDSAGMLLGLFGQSAAASALGSLSGFINPLKVAAKKAGDDGNVKYHAE